MIAVTASAFGDTREAARDAGCVDYLLEAGARRVAVRRAADAPRRAVRVRARRPSRRRARAVGSLAARRPSALRLHDAADIGNVTDLEELAQELAVGRPGRSRRSGAADCAAGRALRLRRVCSALADGARWPARPAAGADVNDGSAMTAHRHHPRGGRQPGEPAGARPHAPGSGHRILAARDGRAALDIAARARPDLMLLDVMMPEMDGFEVCRALKADPRHRGRGRHLPVGARRGGRQGLGPAARRRRLHHQADPGRGGAGAGRQPPDAAVSRARAAPQPRSARPRAGQCRATCSGGSCRGACPSTRRWSFAAFYQTSRHAGGDYYDVIPIGDDRFGIVVADVSGHGAPAAIVMAMIRAVLHTCRRDPARSGGGAAPPQPPLPVPLGHGDVRDRRSTACWTSGARTWRSMRGGHPPPLLVRAGSRRSAPAAVRRVADAAVRRDGRGCVAESRPLLPGDRAGALHRRDHRPTGPGWRSSTTWSGSLRRCRASDCGPGEIVERLVDDLETFAGGREAEDDQTLLVIGIEDRAHAR